LLTTLAAAAIWLAAPAAPATVALDNGLVRRELAFDGGVWRTVAFARSNGTERLDVHSDELHILLFDDSVVTAADYEADGEPVAERDEREVGLVVRYRRRKGRTYAASAPTGFTIRYFARPGEPYLRKRVVLAMPPEAQVDRLEVERFSTKAPAERGGRGEPVFLGGRWFVGVEYPAAHARHTDGNTPRAGSRHYDAVGNYSHIDLEGRDVEARSRPGLVRLMHFPGHARRGEDGSWTIVGKTAAAGVGDGQSMELVFGDYLATIRRPPRSFLTYNNWFDREAKALKGDRLVEVLRQFRRVLDPAGIRIDAMVPDDGWQDKRTLYAPKAEHFPGGLADVAALGRALRAEGSTLGLWLALSAYNQELEPFPRAVPNPYFATFKHYYPLALPAYKDALSRQVRDLVRAGELSYLKHDFNPLLDRADGRGHPATERHSHEAELDAMLDVIATERAVNPDLYLNVTNWIWFSPWWLMQADALWMLAGDDGFNQNWPELAGRAMSSTDRDTYIWRMWGDPKQRPLVPISSLMTHGIIRNAQGRMQKPGDTLADWADHVVMHYGRGVQLKEWYITPSSMSDDEWKALVRMHRYSERLAGAFASSVFIGGRPDEGSVYGYVGWDGDRGVLVARNPSPVVQTLSVPITAETLYRGASRGPFHARVVYPYRGDGPTSIAGQPLDVSVPGYATVVMEIAPGEGQAPVVLAPAPVVRRDAERVFLDVPDEAMARCELIVIGYPKPRDVFLDGALATPQRSGAGEPNQFARYARAGMVLDSARPWAIAAYDLQSRRGRRVEVAFGPLEGGTIEAWWLLDRPVTERSAEDGPLDEPWAITHGFRRQTIEVRPEKGAPPL